MSDDPKRDQAPEQEKAEEVMIRAFANMANASLQGASLMTQAIGLWMSSLSRLMDQTSPDQAEAAASQPLDRTKEAVSKPPAESPPEARPKAGKTAKEKIERPEAALTQSRVQPDQKTVRKKTAPAKAQMIASQAAQQVDDLKKISGIGPKLETILNKSGITTYAQIAALKVSEIENLEDKLGFKGRIDRDGWIDQASKLMAK